MASRVVDILMAQGQQAADAARAKGAIWGGMVERLGEIPGQAVQQYQQQKQQGIENKAKEARLNLDTAHLTLLQQEEKDRMEAARRVREGTAFLANSVKNHSRLNPDTGHVEYDHDAIINETTTAGFPDTADHWNDLGTKIDERVAATQKLHLAADASAQQTRADILGAVASAPKEQRAARYGVMLAGLPPGAKNDPVFGKLPPIYPGDEAFTTTYELTRTNAARAAEAKAKSEEWKAGLREVPSGGTLVHVDEGTGASTTVATGAPDLNKGVHEVPPGGNLVRINPATGQAETVASGGPAPKHYEQKSVLLDGKPAEVRFDPSSGKHLDASGTDVSARVRPIPPTAAVILQQGQRDTKEIAAAIIRGEEPPDMANVGFRDKTAVTAELARQGYDLKTSQLDYLATKRYLGSLNSTQQTRLRQSIRTASDSLPIIDRLAKQWDSKRSLWTGSPILNNASLKAAKGGAYGKEAASIATQLEGQITDLTSELGNVYMGGNSPTDHALQLAGKNLSADWDMKVLLDMTKLARENLRIRKNSMETGGAAGLSTGAPEQPAGSGGGPTEGTQQAIPSIPGGMAEYRGGKWIRVK